jgi:hypothetical protein
VRSAHALPYDFAPVRHAGCGTACWVWLESRKASYGALLVVFYLFIYF